MRPVGATEIPGSIWLAVPGPSSLRVRSASGWADLPHRQRRCGVGRHHRRVLVLAVAGVDHVLRAERAAVVGGAEMAEGADRVGLAHGRRRRPLSDDRARKTLRATSLRARFEHRRVTRLDGHVEHARPVEGHGGVGPPVGMERAVRERRSERVAAGGPAGRLRSRWRDRDRRRNLLSRCDCGPWPSPGPPGDEPGGRRRRSRHRTGPGRRRPDRW